MLFRCKSSPRRSHRILRQILVNKADEKLFLAESQLLVFWIGDIQIEAIAQVPSEVRTQMQKEIAMVESPPSTQSP